MCVQPLAQARSFREFENAIVINNACADIAALQRNNPDPPTPTEKVIGRPLATRSTPVGVIGKTLPPFLTVPLLDATESPDSKTTNAIPVWPIDDDRDNGSGPKFLSYNNCSPR